MADREKVIKGLEHCTNHAFDCFDMDGCPYDNGTGNDRLCMDNLMRDAQELLKEDEKWIANYRRRHENQKNTTGELLKAQEPVKPTVRYMEEYDGHGSNWYVCGACDIPIFPADKYCRNCGRAVKWGG